MLVRLAEYKHGQANLFPPVAVRSSPPTRATRPCNGRREIPPAGPSSSGVAQSRGRTAIAVCEEGRRNETDEIPAECARREPKNRAILSSWSGVTERHPIRH